MKIDTQKAEPLTEEEINLLSDEDILERLKFLELNIGVERNIEQSLKLWMNSSYGVFGSPFFYFGEPHIAEGITSTGKSIILYTQKETNDYFLNKWHKDKSLHTKLGITSEVKKLKKPIVVYAHTDSVHEDTKIKIKINRI